MGGTGGKLALPGVIDKAAATQPQIGESLFFYTVTIPGGPTGTQTGYKERFMLFAPSQQKPCPLLVVFHKFGVSELDAWVNTQFFQEAWARGWHIVAPLSASGVHFGSDPGLINTEAALEYMTANFNVRADRIYGVGFSMGGGMALSYAARHLDPTKPMFAAVVDHTGGISLNDTYSNEVGSQFIFDFWFGDGMPGSADPWEMTAASMFDFNSSTLVVDTTSDMARNLQHMPVKIFRVQDDPLGYLRVQSDVLATHLTGQGTQTKYEVIPGMTHAWSTLSDFTTINWLSKKTLTLPLSGRTLADRDASYFYFTVQQTLAGAFSPFDWDLDLPGNTLTVTDAANLTSLEVETVEAGLDPLSVLRVDMTTADGGAVEYVLRDWAVAPTTVTRDALPSVAFVHDAIGMTLTLQETDGGNHLWEITP